MDAHTLLAGVTVEEKILTQVDTILKEPAQEPAHTWDSLVKGPLCALPFYAQKKVYDFVFKDMAVPHAWTPKNPEHSNIAHTMQQKGFSTYEQFHEWSLANKNDFWLHAMQSIGLHTQPTVLENDDPKDPQWLSTQSFRTVEACFRHRADALAIIHQDSGGKIQRMSYGELKELMYHVSSGLRAHGFSPGDRIAIDMPMTAESVAIYLGIIHAGCVVVSIADSFSAPEIKRRLDIAKAKAIFTVDSFTRRGKTIEMYAKIKDACAPRAIVIGKTKLREGDIDWKTFLTDGMPKEHSAHAYDITNILFSSGTTGDPKAIPWNHLTPIKAAVDAYYHHDIKPNDVLCWPTNLGWMMGPWLIYASLMNNATIALYNGVALSEEFGQFVEKAGVTMLGTVPSLVKNWRATGAMESCNWKSVRVFSSTGECSNAEDYLYLMSLAQYRAPIIEYCGGTEIGGAYITGTVVHPASPATFTTPTLGLNICLLNSEGNEVNENVPAEAFIVPPSIGLSEELLNRDHEEEYFANCPTGPNGEVLRRHGDMLEKLPGGFFRHHGRADDTMNLGGIKISSAELEAIANSHSAVFESAAIATQPQGGGASQLLFSIVLNNEYDKESLKKELQSVIRSELNPLFKIHDILFEDTLPRTASNKVMRRVLRDKYQEKITEAP